MSGDHMHLGPNVSPSLIKLQNLEGLSPPPSFPAPLLLLEIRAKVRVCSKSIRTKLACKFPWGHFKLDPKRINREKAMSKKGHSLLVLLVSIVSNQGKKTAWLKGSFNNYVDRILPFFDLPFFDPPSCMDSFHTLSVSWTTPTHLVHVVIEWPRIKVEFAFLHSVSHFML